MGSSDSTSKFPDFSMRTDIACFKLIVEGKDLFVNPQMISELSPVFAAMVKGNFKEQARQTATIGEEHYNDFLDMLQCCLPSIGPGATKPITVSNFAPMSRLADKFQISSLKAACRHYMQNRFQYEDASLDQVLDALKSASDYQLGKESLIPLVGRAATFEYALLLKKNDMFDWLKPKLLVALFLANKNYSNDQKECREKNGELLSGVGGHCLIMNEMGALKFFENKRCYPNAGSLSYEWHKTNFCMKCRALDCFACDFQKKQCPNKDLRAVVIIPTAEKFVDKTLFE